MHDSLLSRVLRCSLTDGHDRRLTLEGGGKEKIAPPTPPPLSSSSLSVTGMREVVSVGWGGRLDDVSCLR